MITAFSHSPSLPFPPGFVYPVGEAAEIAVRTIVEFLPLCADLETSALCSSICDTC